MSGFRVVDNSSITGLKYKDSEKIIEALTEVSKNYIYQKREARKPNSNQIKCSLIRLGHTLGYKVYANGLNGEQKKYFFENNGFINREYLFDIFWYKEVKDEHYITETVSLVGESELGDRRKGDLSKSKNAAVKFDFQKLLVANAELRLLIFKVKNESELNDLNEYFDKAIVAYKLLQKGSILLFACFNHEKKELLYCEKVKI